MKKGNYLILSTGEYSDYSFTGPYLILKDFTFRQIVDEIKEKFIPTQYNIEPENYSIGPYLIINGYINDIDNCVEVHCGSYGSLEINSDLLDA